MIEKIDRPQQLDAWEAHDLYAIRIRALLIAYGTKYPFCTFYRQVTDGAMTAVIGKLDGSFTLWLGKGYDHEELVHFFCITGYQSILCDARFELSPRYEEGAVMACRTKRDEPLPMGTELDEYPKLMDLYNFIDYEEQDFKAWYVDISHRVRHGTSKAYALRLQGEMISSGVLASMADGDAVLTAVRTHEEFQRMGYGSALVTAICADVPGTVYLMREKGRNEVFYRRLGFENIGTWRMYK